MLENQRKELADKAVEINFKIRSIYRILFELFSMPEKELQIEFKNKKYHFYAATTKKEQDKIDHEKRQLSRLLLKESIYSLIYNITSHRDKVDNTYDGLLKCFDNILAFTQGADPADHKFEKIDLKDIYNVEVATNESGIPALPLNEETIYVQSQNQNISDLELSAKFEEKYAKQDQECDQQIQDN